MPESLRDDLEAWLKADNDVTAFLLPMADLQLPERGDETRFSTVVWYKHKHADLDIPVIIVKYSGFAAEAWPVGALLIMEAMCKALELMALAPASLPLYRRTFEEEAANVRLRRYYIPILYYSSMVPRIRHSLIEFIAVCELSLLYDPIALGYKPGDKVLYHPGLLFVQACQKMASVKLPRITQDKEGRLQYDEFLDALLGVCPSNS